MHCHEFRELMFERLSGELTPEQERACSTHEQSCIVCRAELADTKWISTRLRAGWPNEEPMPIRMELPQLAARNWFDVSALWFSRASAGLVMASLLAMVLLRPSIESDGRGVRIAFGPTAASAETRVASLTPEQVRALVAAEVQKEAGTSAQQGSARVQPTAAAPAVAGQVVEVAQQVRQLQRAQATLWQEVQQHSLYLESLWRTNNASMRPARMGQ